MARRRGSIPLVFLLINFLWTTVLAWTSASRPSSRSSFPLRAVGTDGVRGPSADDKPDYENIVGPLGRPADQLFTSVFRTQLANNVGFDSPRPKTDYQGIIEITTELNKRFSSRTEIQQRAQATLKSLFPSWLPGSYAVLFSKPFPEVSRWTFY